MIVPILKVLWPMVAILLIFGTPVVMYLGSRFFKLKERELQLEGEAQQYAQKSVQALEARVRRLESVLLDADVRSKAALMEGPPDHVASLPTPGDLQKVR